ncbi:hypothetical protein PUN28_011145 [Cardiocondyla obscurior]|uniref:Uncharacterized protein n=1 Tax=Cardiocondyla obscurior TaxID=286306 RepID=A0AAW2FJV0_9HYME
MKSTSPSAAGPSSMSPREITRPRNPREPPLSLPVEAAEGPHRKKDIEEPTGGILKTQRRRASINWRRQTRNIVATINRFRGNLASAYGFVEFRDLGRLISFG